MESDTLLHKVIFLHCEYKWVETIQIFWLLYLQFEEPIFLGKTTMSLDGQMPNSLF